MTRPEIRLIEVGSEMAAREYGPITRTDIVRYAGASGDFHPVHHDDEFARSSGAPSVFAMGMLPASILASYAAEWLGAHGWRRFSVRFEDQVWPGDVLTCSGRVADSQPEPDGGFSALAEFTCSSGARTVLKAVVEVAVDDQTGGLP